LHEKSGFFPLAWTRRHSCGRTSPRFPLQRFPPTLKNSDETLIGTLVSAGAVDAAAAGSGVFFSVLDAITMPSAMNRTTISSIPA
jgi:acetoacetate decarboxylase